MARFSRTPVAFYLELDLTELTEWIGMIGEEIKAENDALNDAGKGNAGHGK